MIMRTTTAALALAVALASASDGEAQMGAIEGAVTDAVTGQPLQGAMVSAGVPLRPVATAATGRYRIEGVPAGEHTVVVRRLGYAEQQRRLAVPAGQTVVADFALAPGQASLDELAVMGVTAEPQARARRMYANYQAVAFDALHAPAFRLRFNTESYAHTPESDFRTVEAAPRSTFSIDVDRASYSNIRRFVESGTRPPADAVRIEEMVNYFPYDWDPVRGDHPFAVATEVWSAPWKREHRLVRIGLHAEAVDMGDLPPSNLVFLIDVSGSMESPDKLPLLKSAFALLTEQLRPQDRVAIVVYAGAAGMALPSTRGDRKADILGAINDLRAGGSTAGGEGIKLAYKIAREHQADGGNNRVILATDGDFNVGASSDAEMVRLIEREREGGTFLTVLGFGTGNLKDSKMEQIADHGNGNFHYIDGILEARKVLVEEMGGTLLTLAKDVKLQVEFNPAHVAAYRLIGYENRLLADEDFNDDSKDAGELGAGHTVTALYEVVPRGVDPPREAVDPLRYQDAAGRDAALNAAVDQVGRSAAGAQEAAADREAAADQDDIPPAAFADELMYVKVRYKDPDGTASKLLEHAVAARAGSPSDDFRFAAAVAGFGMLLRDSEHAGDLTLNDVVRLGEKGRGEDPRGYRGEFIRLVEATRDLGLLTERGWDDRRR